MDGCGVRMLYVQKGSDVGTTAVLPLNAPTLFGSSCTSTGAKQQSRLLLRRPRPGEWCRAPSVADEACVPLDGVPCAAARGQHICEVERSNLVQDVLRDHTLRQEPYELWRESNLVSWSQWWCLPRILETSNIHRSYSA